MMRLHLLNRSGAEYLGYLGGATGKRYLAELNGVGSGMFVLDVADPAAALVAAQQIVRVDIGSVTVGHWVIERIEEVMIDDAGDASGNTLTVSGRGVLALLDKAMVYASGYPKDAIDTGAELDFGPSFGAGWFDLLNGNVELPFGFSFDVDDDSLGDPWLNDLSTSFKCNDTMLRVLQTTSELGIDVWLERDGLMMAAAPAPAGEDLTQDVIFLQGRDIQRMSRTIFSGDLANAVLAVEGAAAYEVYRDVDSMNAYGRLEAAIDTSGKSDAEERAQALLDQLKAPRTTIDVQVNTATWTPLVDYALGDTVALWTARVRTTYRVKAIEIWQFDNEEIGVSLKLDDRVMTYLERVSFALRRSMLPAKMYGLQD